MRRPFRSCVTCFLAELLYNLGLWWAQRVSNIFWMVEKTQYLLLHVLLQQVNDNKWSIRLYFSQYIALIITKWNFYIDWCLNLCNMEDNKPETCKEFVFQVLLQLVSPTNLLIGVNCTHLVSQASHLTALLVAQWI